MRFKTGVVVFDVSPKIRRAWELCDRASLELLGQEATTTSSREGTHSAQSLHYWRPWRAKESDGAWDMRTWRAAALGKRVEYRDRVYELLEEQFPGEFQVMLERTHLHCEHDPEGRAAS